MPPSDKPGTDGDWHREECDLVIGQTADRCFALFTDFERTPEWLVELRSARTRKYDNQARPLVVDYMAAPVRGGYTYPMNYVYHDNSLGLDWHGEVQGGARAIEGAVRFVPLDPARCEMRYETGIRLSDDMPAWFRSSQQDRPADQLCKAFKRWVEAGA